MRWACGRHAFDLGQRTLVMGVVNVTPDSFSDGGRWLAHDAAIAHGLRLRDEGADVVDVGGESTRPGAQPVPVQEELRRVRPVVEALASRGVPVSIDTRRPEVARAALAAGACIVNDVEGLRAPGMAEACADARCGVVVMHMQGQPHDMQRTPAYRDVVAEVRAFLAERAAFAQKAGVPRDALCVDPGIGFGKTLDHNLALLRGLRSLGDLGFPVLVGVSRKGFLGALAGIAQPDQRLHPGLAAAAIAVANGADVIRTHDVRPTVEALKVADALAGKGAR